ncbi:MAG: hypothetical protein DDT23_00376 [candidate division WS2 bacterium]|nr:hypothetical protein [Candidatus Lithacetigena glycinireducens]
MKRRLKLQQNSPPTTECMAEAKERFFRSYFKQGINHVSIVSLEKDTVYVFCYFQHPLPFHGERVFPFHLRLPEEKIRECNCFFDWRGEREMLNSGFGIKLIEKDRGQVMGFYDPVNNVLITSDWTHSSENFPLIEEIMLAIRWIKETPSDLWQEIGLKTLAFANKELISKKITLGADPEFELLRDGWIVPAEEYFSSLQSRIGCDGSGHQLELRPSASSSSEELVKKVASLISEVYSEGFTLSTEGDEFPLGGHLHFGVENFSTSYVELLDLFLGGLLLPLSGEARGSYRRLGKYETKDWGFEYRSLPSAIFASPKIAAIVGELALSLIQELTDLEEVCVDVSKRDLPYIHEYRKRIGHEKTNALLNFVRNKITSFKSEEWGVLESYRISFSSADTFSEDVRGEIIRILGPKIKRNIRFFGLRADRGNDVISGFDAEGYRNIELSGGYGLPYHVRTNNDNFSELHYLLSKIIESQKDERE